MSETVVGHWTYHAHRGYRCSSRWRGCDWKGATIAECRQHEAETRRPNYQRPSPTGDPLEREMGHGA